MRSVLAFVVAATVTSAAIGWAAGPRESAGVPKQRPQPAALGDAARGILGYLAAEERAGRLTPDQADEAAIGALRGLGIGSTGYLRARPSGHADRAA